jgi:uncharacterized phiE125 gp8 family phage protein
MIAQTPVLVTPPAEMPISLAEAKAHLRIDYDDENTLITRLIEAAVSHLDGISGVLGRCLITQSWRQDYDGFPDDRRMILPLRPVSAITSVMYYDAANALQTLSTSYYRLSAEAYAPTLILDPNLSWPTSYDRPDAVQVSFVCGYGAAANTVPPSIRSALLLMIGDLYMNRETVARGGIGQVPMSVTVDRLLAPYRAVGL